MELGVGLVTEGISGWEKPRDDQMEDWKEDAERANGRQGALPLRIEDTERLTSNGKICISSLCLGLSDGYDRMVTFNALAAAIISLS